MKYCPQCAAELIEKEMDEIARLVCGAECGFIHWGNPTPVVAAIIEYDGKVLLARNALWPEGWFALVTGFLEQKETPEEAVLREVEEEVGLKGELKSFVGHYAFKEQNQLLIMYHVKASGDIQLGEEIVEVKLEDKKDVRPWPMGTGPGLYDWLVAEGFEPEYMQFGD